MAIEAEAGAFVAFDVPPATPGNPSWPGALGMDFEVVNAITISHLGVFDGGPQNRYAAGTFHFEPYTAPPPAKLTVSVAADGTVLTWGGIGVLETADSVMGLWQPVPGAASGLTVRASERSRFFRLRQ